MSDPGAVATDVIVQAAGVVRHFKWGGGIVGAVDGVSLALERGKMTALQGPSGCGKSTLLNLLAALDRPDEGTLVVDGTDLGSLSGRQEVRYRRERVGLVFQQFNLISQLTAAENVMLPMELSGGQDRHARAVSLLERVGLHPSKHDRRPAKLSGGEQQRVAIARALANDPPLVLADEPTANLDQKTGRTIIALLKRLTQDGRTLVVATHDESIARQSDRVLQMEDGRMRD